MTVLYERKIMKMMGVLDNEINECEIDELTTVDHIPKLLQHC